MGHTDHAKSPQEGRLNPMEEQFRSLLASVQALKSEISDLRKVVETLESSSSDAANRYVATCPACSTRYDMLAHHYSIGLFDNMVYVKCPKCNKGMPVQGGAGGEISAVADGESY